MDRFSNARIRLLDGTPCLTTLKEHREDQGYLPFSVPARIRATKSLSYPSFKPPETPNQTSRLRSFEESQYLAATDSTQ